MKGMQSTDGSWQLWGELWKHRDGGRGRGKASMKRELMYGIDSVSALCQCWMASRIPRVQLSALRQPPALLPQQLQDREQDSINTINKMIPLLRSDAAHRTPGCILSMTEVYNTMCFIIWRKDPSSAALPLGHDLRLIKVLCPTVDEATWGRFVRRDVWLLIQHNTGKTAVLVIYLINPNKTPVAIIWNRQKEQILIRERLKIHIFCLLKNSHNESFPGRCKL